MGFGRRGCWRPVGMSRASRSWLAGVPRQSIIYRGLSCSGEKKTPPGGRLVARRRESNEMIAALLVDSGVDFDSASELEQALVGTFAFGMITAYGIVKKLDQPDIHALAPIVFQETLHYTAEAAAQGVQHCINATNRQYHQTMNAILHRGADGLPTVRRGTSRIAGGEHPQCARPLSRGWEKGDSHRLPAVVFLTLGVGLLQLASTSPIGETSVSSSPDCGASISEVIEILSSRIFARSEPRARPRIFAAFD